MIDEKKLIEDIKKCNIEFMSHWYTNGEILDIICDIIECQNKIGGWIPCSERLPEEKINPVFFKKYRDKYSE